MQEGYARSYIYKHTVVMESQSNSLLLLFKCYQDRVSCTALAVWNSEIHLALAVWNSEIHLPL